MFTKKLLLTLAALSASIPALADTTYDLPDPAVAVTISQLYNTTRVTVGGVQYSGPSAFYHLSDCPVPNAYARRCEILEEDAVTLTSIYGSTIVVTVVDQHLAVLVRSGHNYFRISQTVIGGMVTTP